MAEESRLTDKLDFVERHAGEIKPVLSDDLKGKLDRLDELSEQELDEILGATETKVFIYQKKQGEYEPGAKNVYLTIADPGAFNVIGPIRERMESDQRVRAIGVLTHGVAGVDFEKAKRQEYARIYDPKRTVLQDIQSATQIVQPDIVLASVSTQNGPEHVALFGGKGNLGASKIFLIMDGWTGLGSAFAMNRRVGNIDGVFVNDDLARRVALRSLPSDFPQERVYATGTPTIDSIDNSKADEYAAEGRRKLGIGEETFAFLYGGGEQSAWAKRYGTDPQIETKTFRGVVESLTQLARSKPEDNFALLVRPHPRDPEKDTIFDTSGIDLPANLKAVPAGGDIVSFDQATYAADVSASIISTENFKMPLRGREGVFLAFEGKGMGEYMIRKLFGEEIYEELKANPGVRMVTTRQELIEYLKDKEHHEQTPPKPHQKSDSVEKILDIILR